jgi:hypothetical protein
MHGRLSWFFLEMAPAFIKGVESGHHGVYVRALSFFSAQVEQSSVEEFLRDVPHVWNGHGILPVQRDRLRELTLTDRGA